MKIHEIVCEAIVNRPRNIKLFLEKAIQTITEVETSLLKCKEVIEYEYKHGDGDYLISYALKKLSDNEVTHAPSFYTVDLDRLYLLDSLKHNLLAIINHGYDRFLDHILNTLKRIEPITDEDRKILEYFVHIDDGLREYGFDPNENYDDDLEYTSAKKSAAAYAEIGKNLIKLEAMFGKLKPFFSDMGKRSLFNRDPHKYRPDHEEIEKLYHASIFASDLVQNGFKDVKPKDRYGVGNFGDQPTISFTSDIRIAHDIMRAFKEIWMIVHGQLTRKEIVSWIKEEGLDLKKVSSLWILRDEDLNSIPQILRLYRAYLGYSSIRSDPVFAFLDNIIEPMTKIKLSDIGIISCDVRLDGSESYHHGEAEFRVQSSQIVGKISRVI